MEMCLVCWTKQKNMEMVLVCWMERKMKNYGNGSSMLEEKKNKKLWKCASYVEQLRQLLGLQLTLQSRKSVTGARL